MTSRVLVLCLDQHLSLHYFHLWDTLEQSGKVLKTERRQLQQEAQSLWNMALVHAIYFPIQINLTKTNRTQSYGQCLYQLAQKILMTVCSLTARTSTALVVGTKQTQAEPALELYSSNRIWSRQIKFNLFLRDWCHLSIHSLILVFADNCMRTQISWRSLKTFKNLVSFKLRCANPSHDSMLFLFSLAAGRG